MHLNIYHMATSLLYNTMSSKIDPHFAHVFEQLNGRGLSYRAVCTQLLGMGVEISHQALRSWHLRRSRKITVRSAAISVHAGVDLSVCVPDAPAPSTARPTKPSVVSPTVFRASTSRRVNELQEEIEKQQERLASSPFSIANTNFLVRPKR